MKPSEVFKMNRDSTGLGCWDKNCVVAYWKMQYGGFKDNALIYLGGRYYNIFDPMAGGILSIPVKKIYKSILKEIEEKDNESIIYDQKAYDEFKEIVLIESI